MGGGLQIDWLDRDTSAVVKSRTHDDKPHNFKGTVEQSLFYAEIMKLPKITSYEIEMFTDPDIVIDELVNEVLLTKRIKSDLKKNVTIQCKDGTLLTWKISPAHTLEILKSHAIKLHPEAKIINNLDIPEVIKIYKEAEV